MSKQIFRFAHDEARRRAAQACLSAPEGYVCTIREATRSLDQNALLWALLTDLSRQVMWPVDGELVKLEPEDWKDITTAALRREMRVAKGIDGGHVMLGTRTSRMTKRDFSDLCELILAFGAARGVEWSR